MKKSFSTKVLIIMVLGVVFNVVLALIGRTIGGDLLFLDTVGTFCSCFFWSYSRYYYWSCNQFG